MQDKKIFRAENTSCFTKISNSLLQESDLSMQAQGLLTSMLSFPDNWSFFFYQLVNLFNNGEKAIRSALRELESKGYVKRILKRDKSKRFAGVKYIVIENPKRPKPSSKKANDGMTSGQKSSQINNNIQRENLEINNLTKQDQKRVLDLKMKLEACGWVGNIKNIIDWSGSVNSACYFWDTCLEHNISSVSTRFRGSYITNRYKADATIYWNLYLDQEKEIKQQKAKVKQQMMLNEEKRQAEEEKYQHILNEAQKLWQKLSPDEKQNFTYETQQRLGIKLKYDSQKDCFQENFGKDITLYELYKKEVDPNLE